MQYCHFRSLRWFPVLLQYFQTHMCPSDWVFLVLQYLRNFFAAFLCFSGLLLRDNFGPIQWVLSLSSHNFGVEVVSQILCWVGILVCRLAVIKMHVAHSRRTLWSPNFSFPYFPFNILRPSMPKSHTIPVPKSHT